MYAVRWKVILVCLAPGLVSFVTTACSSCSSEDTNMNDAGKDTSSGGGDGDSDGDVDGDSDGDSDGDADTDNCDETDAVSSSGSWDWTDLPAGEDCGEGCVQLSFGEEVRENEWDVWENKLVYLDSNTVVHVVDLTGNQYLRLPNYYPDLGIGINKDMFVFNPVLYEDNVYYSQKIYISTPQIAEIVHADLDLQVQKIVASRVGSAEELEVARQLDVHGDRLVSSGGCGPIDKKNICWFGLPGPCSESHTVFEYHFGADTSVWDNLLAWDYNGTTNILLHNFATEETKSITTGTAYQILPRIHDDKLVYTDLRHGSGDPSGAWDHAAVYKYDAAAESTEQITSAEWICSFPDIHENIIVWMDYRECGNPNNKNDMTNVEIWGYNIETEQTFQITNLPGRTKGFPRIWGNRVFVHMYKLDGGNAIYMFDLPDGAK